MGLRCLGWGLKESHLYWQGSSGKRRDLSLSWYGMTRLSGGRGVCSRYWVSCIVSMSKEYPGVFGPSGGVVKALVNVGAGRPWPPQRLRLESFTASRCSHPFCFRAAPESSQWTVGHVVTSTLQSNYRIFMPVDKGRSDGDAQDSCLWKGVCLKSVSPWASPHKAGSKLER